MVRNQGPIMPDDESTPVSRDDERGNGGSFRRSTKRASAGVDDDLDNRFAGLDDEEGDEQQFRRAPRRIPVRRGAVTKKVANRLKIAIIALIVAGAVGTIAAYLYSYGMHSWRFRIESSDNIQITGNKHVSRAQILQVMGGDIGRNVYFVPLSDRRKAMEQIPWVQSASVMRLLPNRLRVDIQERTPVAFVQLGQHVELIDGEGVVMDIPASTRTNWAFPVIVGMRENDPLSTRAARMKIYQKLIADLDSTGEKNSVDLNEVDLSDPENVKVTVAQDQRDIIVQLGDSDFLGRFDLFKTHLKEWQQQHANLQSVDLRYERQVILSEDPGGSAPPKSVTVPKPGVKKVKSSAVRKRR
jgi:cell division protein FtsQ